MLIKTLETQMAAPGLTSVIPALGRLGRRMESQVILCHRFTISLGYWRPYLRGKFTQNTRQ